MYTPKQFAPQDHAALIDFVNRNPFAHFITSDRQGEMRGTGVVAIIESQSPDRLVLAAHMSRKNPNAAALFDGCPSLAIFQGPHAYVSPRWYRVNPDVPTWNYVAVHAHGSLEVIDEVTETEKILRMTVDHMERGEREPWRLEMAPADYLARIIHLVSAFRMTVTRLEGAFKLSQNKCEQDRATVIAGLVATGTDSNLALARIMAKAFA